MAVQAGQLSALLQTAREGMTHAIASPGEWEAKRANIRAHAMSTFGAPPDVVPPLDLAMHDEVRCEGYVRRLVSYAVEQDERVRAWVLVPDGAIRNPAVLCLHQTVAEGKDEAAGIAGSSDLAYAHHLALRGFVTFAPDHLSAGERAPDSGAYDTAAFYRRHPGWSAVGKAIWDSTRAVDVMTTLPEIDPARIGVIGHSLGGHGAVFAAAFDDRIAACVSNCGLTTFADNPRRLDWSRDHWYIYIPSLRTRFLAGLDAPFDFHELVACIAPRAFLNISSLSDGVMGISDRALIELYGEARGVWRLLGASDRLAAYFHDRGHSFPAESRAIAYGWLAEKLGLAEATA